jgi:hypothetical protein
LISILQTSNELNFFSDDVSTGVGDGFAIDFVRLIINPKQTAFNGTVSGTVIDADTKTPIIGAQVEYKGISKTTTNKAGSFSLQNVPHGFIILTANAKGYNTNSTQIEIVADREIRNVVIELAKGNPITEVEIIKPDVKPIIKPVIPTQPQQNTPLVRGFDFEQGTLSLANWIKEGTAFNNQPTYGHNVNNHSIRRRLFTGTFSPHWAQRKILDR